ncbi:MAG: IMP dehydrogenase [Thiohalomonadaceae bacterium]
MGSPKVAFTFDDIAIMPAVYSKVKSRHDVDTTGMLHDIELPLPLLSASMAAFDVLDGGIYLDFAKHMYHAGGMHVFSRRNSFYERVEVASELYDEGIEYGIAVSLFEFISYRNILENLHCFISIDIANGAILPDFHDWSGKYPLIVGNFGNPKAPMLRLREDDSKDTYTIYKLGVGSGSACTTRQVTGVGTPQAWLISEARKYDVSAAIISDGGVNTPGDFCKALALGADAVMCGSTLAAARETPNEPVKIGDRWYKPYSGEASSEAKGGSSFIEGVSGFVQYEDKSVYDLLDEFSDGLKSSMTYVGVDNLIDFPDAAEIVMVSPTAVKENGVRVYHDERNYR